MSLDYQIERSRAVEPLFYSAPHPEQVTPYPFQLAGVEYAIERPHALFGDAPGVGKTAECIMLGNAIEAKRTLVVCPASLRLNWEKEIRAWSTLTNVSTYPVLKSRDGVSLQADYVIISYALLTNPSILNAIMDANWDHLILDEAHALKDPRGNKRTQVICAPDLLPSVVGRITMASGTILPNQPIECYNALRLLNHDAIDGMSLRAFREEYYRLGQGFVTIRGKVQWSDKVRNVPTNLDDLQRRLRGHIMVRRLKEQCLGADTLVLTDTGWEFIIAVTPNHRVWDGIEWVNQDGLMHQGSQRVINLAGVSVTPSHGILIGQEWVMAQEVNSENMMRLALATAMENLPLQTSNMALTAALKKLKFSVLVETSFLKVKHIWQWVKLSVAVLAPLRGPGNLVLRRGMQSVLRLAQMRFIGNGCWAGSTGAWGGVSRGAIKTTLDEVFLSMIPGKQRAGERTFLRTSQPYLGGIIQICKSIGLTMTKVMSRGTFDLRQGSRMGKIEGQLEKCKSASTDLKPVYDLVNAGPRQRFTILSERGPLIVHNCLAQLPPKQWHMFPLEMTAAIRKALKHPGWAEAEKLYEMDADQFNSGIPIDGAIATARRELGEAKAPKVVEYIEELLDEGIDKIVVSAWHLSVLHYLREKLSKHGLVYMDGSTSAKNKQAAVDQFQTDVDVKIILGQMLPLGEGWTLTVAQDAVLAEFDWVPGKNDQLLDRIHRIGQEGEYILGHVPVVPDTLDERILSTAIAKDVNIYKALDAPI